MAHKQNTSISKVSIWLNQRSICLEKMSRAVCLLKLQRCDRDFSGSTVVKILLILLQGPQVRSLVGKLRCRMPSRTKKQQQQQLQGYDMFQVGICNRMFSKMDNPHSERPNLSILLLPDGKEGILKVELITQGCFPATQAKANSLPTSSLP